MRRWLEDRKLCPFRAFWGWEGLSLDRAIEGHTPASSQGHFFTSWVRPLIFRSKVRKTRPCIVHQNGRCKVFFHTLFRYDHHISCLFLFEIWAERPWNNFINHRIHLIISILFPIFPHSFHSISPAFSIFSNILHHIPQKRKEEGRRKKKRSGSVMVCCPMPWNCQRREKKREERRREWAEKIGRKVRK